MYVIFISFKTPSEPVSNNCPLYCYSIANGLLVLTTYVTNYVTEDKITF